MSDIPAKLQSLLDDIGKLIKREHTSYDEHAADPRWGWYARVLKIKEEVVAWKMGNVETGGIES